MQRGNARCAHQTVDVVRYPGKMGSKIRIDNDDDDDDGDDDGDGGGYGDENDGCSKACLKRRPFNLSIR